MASEPALAREKTSSADFGAMLYVVGALVLLGGAIFGYLQYSSKQSSEKLALTPEAKAYVQSLQLSDVEMKATDSYLSQRVIEIQGKIGNAGARPLEVVEIFCIFRDVYGQTILRARVPIVTRPKSSPADETERPEASAPWPRRSTTAGRGAPVRTTEPRAAPVVAGEKATVTVSLAPGSRT